MLNTDYIKYIGCVCGGMYDLVMVDGVSATRCECVKVALDHVAPGGWLVFDNSEKEKFSIVHRLMRRHDNVTFRGNGPRHESGQYKITTTFWKIDGGAKHGH